MDIQKVFVGIRRTEATLPQGDSPDGSLLIVSTQKDEQIPGIVCNAHRDIAAKCIYEGSHALATPEQAEAYRAKLHSDAEAVRMEVLKSKQQMVVPMDPALFNTHFQPVAAEARQAQRGAK